MTAVFNVSFANKGTAKVDYSVLVDQLSVYESQLSADGKLSPGDYKLLADKARSIYAHPGLTPANRGAIEAKIAAWKSDASKTALKDSEDLTRLNNEAKDDSHNTSMFLGNDPVKFLNAQEASQKAKISSLANSIDDLTTAGDDPSAHVNEYTSELQKYRDTLEALDAVKNHKPGQAPASDQVAYLTTNNKGEIVNVSVGREGSQPGYLETNGLYGGLKIYGKLNHSENSKNVFILGDKRFSGVNVLAPGPDGTLKPSTLIDESLQRGKPGLSSAFVPGAGGTYSEIDPTKVRTQSAIPSGAYGRGSNGFLYKKNDDGSYTKYVNSDAKKLNISDNEIVDLPKSYERSILPQVKSTIDSNTVEPTIPVPQNLAPSVSAPTMRTGPQAPAPAGHEAASAPVERAPSTALGIATGALSAAKGYLGKLFGGGAQ